MNTDDQPQGRSEPLYRRPLYPGGPTLEETLKDIAEPVDTVLKRGRQRKLDAITKAIENWIDDARPYVDRGCHDFCIPELAIEWPPLEELMAEIERII